MKLLLLLPIVLMLFFSVIPPIDAHQSGCHRWHSCPSDSGSYVCGDKGYDTYCPTYTVVKQPVQQPVKQEEFQSSPVLYSDMTPKEQLSQGVEPENVQCEDGLELHVKLNDTPICIKESTFEKLVERGWTFKIN